MRKTAMVCGTILAIGCKQTPSDDTDSVRQLREDTAELSADLSGSEQAAFHLSAHWASVETTYEATHQEWVRARARLEEAERTYGQAAIEFDAAAREAEEAAVRFRLYQDMLLAAARIDAGNLDSYRHFTGRSDVNGDFDCASVSTARFRRDLAKLGVSLVGQHVDHIVPQSLGGADHPSNYQLLDARTNQSLGNTWNEAKCMSVGSERCAEAVAVSRNCGSYQGPWF